MKREWGLVEIEVQPHFSFSEKVVDEKYNIGSENSSSKISTRQRWELFEKSND